MPDTQLSLIGHAALFLIFAASAPVDAQQDLVDALVDTSTAMPAKSPLNARVAPMPSAAIGATIPHGSSISLHGACRRYNASYTKVLSAYDIRGFNTSAAAQARMALSRTWCVAWVQTSNGNSSSLWVSAKYVTLK